ncbi:histidine phosphatase family protein [Vibrio tubiashii]|uniref:histidine phosphatase family protein n=1 Tax=Vibrio tubiashii TaxID=29498 RepID=UPI001EFE1BBD|nr:histidine phosphatase family protein [Vibrio tubiashii]MCG9579546.1 histidine phosphatase family protein [Vibrio tubiashii]
MTLNEADEDKVPKTINIYLLRHGKTVGEPALYGHTDIEVALERQAEICRCLLEDGLDFSAVQTSPLKRCSDLAKLIHAKMPELELAVKSDWKETYFGDLDGVPFEQAKSSWELLGAFWQDPKQNPLPKAEPLGDFYLRISASWDAFAKTVDKDTLIVCHGGTIRMILAKILQLDWSNAALYSTLNIAHQSLTHIQITKADQDYFRVCMIGKPLIG